MEISYYIDRRVILARLSGQYTIEVAHESNQASIELIRAGQAPVHLIIDITEVTGYPINLRQLSGTVSLLREPNLGWIIAVGGNPLARFFGSMAMQIGHADFRFVETMPEAIDILQRVDSSLGQPT